MKNIIKLEELGMLLLSMLALSWMNLAWWYYLLLLIAPDISMLGYLAGNKTGAFAYNLFHHKGIAVILIIAGAFYSMEIFAIAGIIIFGHSSLDRMLGYGLKYEEGFKFTHLGKIGKE